MGTGYVERVVERLREDGLKVTPQRIAILQYLDGNRRHPSVEEIYRQVQEEFPTISLATVYNTLQTLLRIREVQTVTVNPSRKHYDPDTSEHHHAICTRCHAIRDVYADYRSVLQVPADVHEAFEVDTVSVCFRGTCRTCEKTVN